VVHCRRFLLQTIVPLRNSEDEEEEEEEEENNNKVCGLQQCRSNGEDKVFLFIYLFILGARWGGDTQRQGTTVLLFPEIWIIEQ
jgi:hypothetical protein